MTLFPCKCPCTLCVDGVRTMGEGEGAKEKKLNVPWQRSIRNTTLLKLLATVAHGPAVPAVTMKLCTQ